MTTQELERLVAALAARVESLETLVNGLIQNPELSYTQKLRITNALIGTRTYFVSSTNGGATDVEIIFKDGILTDEN